MCKALRFLLVLSVLSPAGASWGRDWQVPGDHATIGEAISAARDGDTISIAPGTYREEIKVDRRVSLIGAGADKCIIQAIAEGSTVIEVLADSRIEGVTVRDGAKGIYVGPATTLIVEKCHIRENATDGIHLADDFNTILKMRDCVVSGNKDGVDLESNQAWFINTRFENNLDDGLDLDGEAGILVYGCQFLDNADDGIEIRIAVRVHAILVNSSFERNGEDGVEIINSPDPASEKYNILSVQNCTFDGNKRFGVGFPSNHPEEYTGEMSRTAVYASGNAFQNPGQGNTSPNYESVFAPPIELYPRDVQAHIQINDKQYNSSVDVSVPTLVAIYDLQPTTDGVFLKDAEGVTVTPTEVIVADDESRCIYFLDRWTGRVADRIAPTAPFADAVHTAIGPEGLDVVISQNGQDVLLLADDDNYAMFTLSMPTDTSNDISVIRQQSTEHIGKTEGVEQMQDGRLLITLENSLLPVDSESLSPVGDKVTISFTGFGEHLAGVGVDEQTRRVYATFSAHKTGVKQRQQRSAFCVLDPDLQQVEEFWHLGPFSEDPRGISVRDGLVYVVDGRNNFTDMNTGEYNRNGIKVYVFLLDSGQDALDRALPSLPLRRDAVTPNTVNAAPNAALNGAAATAP